MQLKTNAAGYDYLEDNGKVSIYLNMSSGHINMHPQCIDTAIKRVHKKSGMFSNYLNKTVLVPTRTGNRRVRLFRQENYPTLLLDIINNSRKQQYIDAATNFYTELEQANFHLELMGEQPKQITPEREILEASYIVTYDSFMNDLEQRTSERGHQRTMCAKINDLLGIPKGQRRNCTDIQLQLMISLHIALRIRMKTIDLCDWDLVNYLKVYLDNLYATMIGV